MAGQRAPFPNNPEDFVSDTRISFSKAADNYILEDENGEEWEWFSRTSKWVPMMDEALAEQQRAAYKMPGVDDDEPAVDPTKKRKAAEAEHENAKKQKNEKPKERVNTAIYVESLPKDVSEEELFECFSRYGVIAESIDDNKPRIKMYYNEEGEFNGDALIVYFRPESVNLAINMLDDSDFRLGVSGVKGKMRVKVADQSYKVQKDRPAVPQDAKKKGTSANRDREKAIKKAEEMNRRLNDWDEDDVSVIPATSNNWDKVVVLKNIFTLDDLEQDEDEDEDESMADFLIRDMKEQCSKFGNVENAVLFDAEPEGIMTVRFTNGSAAHACVKKMHGRRLEGRLVEARIADGTERFQKRGAAAEREE